MKFQLLSFCFVIFILSCKKGNPNPTPSVSVASLNCSSASASTGIAGMAYSGTLSISYTGGNGVSYDAGSSNFRVDGAHTRNMSVILDWVATQ